MSRTIHVIDSHTAGEPTRVVIEGGPDLGSGSVAEQLQVFRSRHDRFRSAVVNEPRGSDVLVGALLVKPRDASCVAGVIFFNNVGTLGMCGHGTIGLIATLAHLGRVKPGTHRIETNVGVVAATLHGSGDVSVENVPSYRKTQAAAIEVPGLGVVRGDVAWAGNWFYLVENHGQTLELSNCERLTDVSWRIRKQRGTTQPSRLAFKTILAFAEERGVRYQPKGDGATERRSARRIAPRDPGTRVHLSPGRSRVHTRPDVPGARHPRPTAAQPAR